MTQLKTLTKERAKELEKVYDALPTKEYEDAIKAAHAKLEEIYTNFSKEYLVEEKDFKDFMSDAWDTVRDHVRDEPLNYPTRADAVSLHAWHVICMAQEDKDE